MDDFAPCMYMDEREMASENSGSIPIRMVANQSTRYECEVCVDIAFLEMQIDTLKNAD